ncbi:MAG: aminopeptidase [Desulfohalobiaceae bacterium]
MLKPEHLEKYSDILLWGIKTARKKSYLPGEIVLLRYDLAARDLLEVLFQKVLHQGLQPVQRINPFPAMEHAFFEYSDSGQLTFIPPGEKELHQNLNGLISLLAPESLTHLQDINPESIGQAMLARKQLRDILEDRENQREFGWTLCLLTTPELAKNAGLSQDEYTAQIVKACYLDHPKPVQKWQEILKAAQEIKDWLNNLEIDYLHLESENCDLWITPGRDRRWVGVSGHNIPSFEIFTSPDWRGTQGVFYMDQPSFRSGNLVQDLRLEFREGVVTDIQASLGEEFVRKQLKVDGNADKVGEFSLTDKRFSRIDKFMAHTLYDENFAGAHGNCHIALGASYAETYAKGAGNLNTGLKEKLGFNDSALHWDLVNIEPKKVTAKLSSGGHRLIYQDGCFNL